MRDTFVFVVVCLVIGSCSGVALAAPDHAVKLGDGSYSDDLVALKTNLIYEPLATTFGIFLWVDWSAGNGDNDEPLGTPALQCVPPLDSGPTFVGTLNDGGGNYQIYKYQCTSSEVQQYRVAYTFLTGAGQVSGNSKFQTFRFLCDDFYLGSDWIEDYQIDFPDPSPLTSIVNEPETGSLGLDDPIKGYGDHSWLAGC